MKNILVRLALVGGVAAAVVTATGAFFSDTETSVNNTFEAGSLDLQVGNTSYYNLVENAGTTWTLSDLTDELFFDFDDVKPGDLGEDTIQLRVTDNPAWACVNLEITENDDVSSTEPELEDGDIADDPIDLFDGELANELNFVFWRDDGDNVLEDDETVLTQGPAADVLNGVTWALADSAVNNLGGAVGEGMQGATDYYIGKAWCYGTLGLAPVAQAANDPTVTPGVTCDGGAVDNTSQTDNLVGDISFYVEQHRNNPNFVCSDELFTPEP